MSKSSTHFNNKKAKSLTYVSAYTPASPQLPIHPDPRKNPHSLVLAAHLTALHPQNRSDLLPRSLATLSIALTKTASRTFHAI